MKVQSILILSLVFLAWAAPALAQGEPNLPTTVEGLIVSLYNGAVRVVGLAAFLMLLYAGVLRLMGNSSESNQVIIDAVVGTVLLLSAVVILNSINPDLTRQKGLFEERGQSSSGARSGSNPIGKSPNAGGSILPIVVQ